MKLVIAATGASGTIYLQRLLAQIDSSAHEVHLVMSASATLGRIASGSSDSALLRGADVFLKERRKLILVPRETPWNLVHARNVVTLLEAGAIVMPAIPSFYSRPDSIAAVVDTVVWRILDQIGLPNPHTYRWGQESASAKRKKH